MSLFVVVKCSDGFAICADSQEIVEGYRVSVQKIKPRRCGNFDIAIGGVTNAAELVDSFVRRFEVGVTKGKFSTLDELEEFGNGELLNFRELEAQTYSPEQLARMEFVIAAKPANTPSVQVWRTAASRLIPIEDYALVGWQPELYKQVASGLYRPDMPLVQGIFFGLRILALAKDTSYFVNSPFTVIVAKENGLWLDKTPNIDNVLSRLAAFSKLSSTLMLDFPDISLNETAFKQKLLKFQQDVFNLRRAYFEATIKLMASEGFANCNDPYPRIPLGTVT